jgi:hypothetical protein
LNSRAPKNDDENFFRSRNWRKSFFFSSIGFCHWYAGHNRSSGNCLLDLILGLSKTRLRHLQQQQQQQQQQHLCTTTIVGPKISNDVMWTHLRVRRISIRHNWQFYIGSRRPGTNVMIF